MIFPIEEAEKAIKINFRQKAILQQAFVHRSYLNENQSQKLTSNERLEFLGDAILEFWVSKIIFNRFSDYPEGLLTDFRSQVVYTQSLADIARNLNLGHFLLLSIGEEREGGRENSGLLADTFEALIGAIFQDQGLIKTEQFLERVVFPRIEIVARKKTLKDSKSQLQELVQEHKQPTPVYRLLSAQGPDHERNFKVGVFVNQKRIAVGQGPSKQKAQQQAAQKAVEKLTSSKSV